MHKQLEITENMDEHVERKSFSFRFMDDLFENRYFLFLQFLCIIIAKVSILYQISFLYYCGMVPLFIMLFSSLPKKEKLVLLLPPSLFLMGQAPKTMGLPELYFSLIFASLLGNFLLENRKSLIYQVSKRKIFLALGVTAFILINLMIALNRQIDLKDWVRGIIPLFTGLLYFPLSKMYQKNDKRIITAFHFSCIVTLMFFSLQVIVYYFSSKLYEAHWYELIEWGKWARVNEQWMLQYPSKLITFWRPRITFVLPEATNPLVPLGGIIGVILYCFSKNFIVHRLSICLVLLSTVAVTITVTRSMICSVLVVLALLFFLLLYKYKSLVNRFLKIILITLIIFVTTVFAANLKDIYFNRFDIMSQYVQKDESINIRLYEFICAMDLFKTSPYFGAGFGVKHKIAFEPGFGIQVEQEVPYIHNWFFYFLMCGGIIGSLFYMFYLLYPLFWSRNLDDTKKSLIALSVIFLITYGSFFAVFRLITFNFILACVWAYIYGFSKTTRSPSCAG